MKRQALLLLSLGLLFLIQTRGISWSQTTERVSVDTAFGNSDGGSNASSISSDGNYVAFQSEATDLVPAGSNGLIQIFVHDRQTGTTAQVSVDSNGDEGDFPSSDPAISSDGRYVVFMSDATNLLGVGNDTNGWSDIFVRDRDADDDGIYDEAGGVSTVRVSVYSDGAESNDPSTFPAISGSGRYVAFGSGGELDLTATELLLLFDVFVHDRDTDGDGIYDEPGEVSTAQVSVDSAGN
jgi:Tol biopolymer transport system component